MDSFAFLAWANFVFALAAISVNLGYVLIVKQTSVRLIKTSKVVIQFAVAVVYCTIIIGNSINPILMMLVTALLLLTDAIGGLFRYLQVRGAC